jgi:hypothetical protein
VSLLKQDSIRGIFNSLVIDHIFIGSNKQNFDQSLSFGCFKKLKTLQTTLLRRWNGDFYEERTFLNVVCQLNN